MTASLKRLAATLWRPDWRGFSAPLSLLLVGPLVIGLCVAFILPVGRLLEVSVWNPDFTIAELVRIAETPLYLRILGRTFLLGAVVTILTLVLAYPVAFLMARLTGWRLALAAACVMVPLWTSVLVRSYAWIIILQRNGLLNSMLKSLGLIDAPLPLLYNELSVAIAMTHVLLPYMILPIWAALRTIPRELPLAAQSLGANAVRVFLLVVLPLSLPGVASGVLMVFILSLGFYVTPALVGGPETLMIATLIGQQTTELLNWPFAGALAALLLGITLLLVAVFNRFLGLDKKAAS
ncbi:ABC transporter permease [Azospirillum sp. TSO22-1]|uniref:ABC transporter permease n=1 Tax=Azospirillum sp. TSO22-1 TaxID=716789 RepID=UPI000D603EA6|nr:ABC transporter permease [Azospirillum sp. TSO22-1]PWC56803.1 ABC transporter permease [Azospirillum sp. TSO22-1]